MKILFLGLLLSLVGAGLGFLAQPIKKEKRVVSFSLSVLGVTGLCVGAVYSGLAVAGLIINHI